MHTPTICLTLSLTLPLGIHLAAPHTWQHLKTSHVINGGWRNVHGCHRVVPVILRIMCFDP